MSNKLNCRKCKKCNCKGKPSVSKDSLYCQKQRKIIPKVRESLYHKIKRIKNSFLTKREHRVKEVNENE